MRRLISAFAVLSCALAVRPAPAESPEPFDVLYARLTKTREVFGVDISPDGKLVARAEPVRDEKALRASRILREETRPAGSAVQITGSIDGSEVREADVALSPDGRTRALGSQAGGAGVWTA